MRPAPRIVAKSCAENYDGERNSHSWISVLTGRYVFWAWVSLFSVWGADVYVWLLMVGFIPDARVV